MGDLSEHFDRNEFNCKCGCGFDTVDAELINGPLEFLRTDNVKVVINSGNRCVEHNELVQKAANPHYLPFSSDSQHLYGKAADIYVMRKTKTFWEIVPPEEVYSKLLRKYPGKYGIGLYRTHVHIDVLGRTARWDRR